MPADRMNPSSRHAEMAPRPDGDQIPKARWVAQNGHIHPKSVIELIRVKIGKVTLFTARGARTEGLEPARCCLRAEGDPTRPRPVSLSQTPSYRRPNPTVGSERHVGSMRATVTEGFALQSGDRRTRSRAPRRYGICSAVKRASRRSATFSTRGLGPRFAKRAV